jgi:hypothetical protein
MIRPNKEIPLVRVSLPTLFYTYSGRNCLLHTILLGSENEIKLSGTPTHKATCYVYYLLVYGTGHQKMMVGGLFFFKSQFLFFSDIPEFQVGGPVNQQIKNMWPNLQLISLKLTRNFTFRKQNANNKCHAYRNPNQATILFGLRKCC